MDVIKNKNHFHSVFTSYFQKNLERKIFISTASKNRVSQIILTKIYS